MYLDIKCFKYFQFILQSFVCIGDHSHKYTFSNLYTLYFWGHFIIFCKVLAIK